MSQEFRDEYKKNEYAIVKKIGEPFQITATNFIELMRTGRAEITTAAGDSESVEIVEDNLEED